jgi:hypothetical protein
MTEWLNLEWLNYEWLNHERFMILATIWLADLR